MEERRNTLTTFTTLTVDCSALGLAQPKPVVLARRPSGHPAAYWEARVGSDRARLEVVLVVQPSSTPIVVPMLTNVELEALLSEAPAERAESWSCRECTHVNPASRRWCDRCSSHDNS